MATTNVSFQCTSRHESPFQYALTASRRFVVEASAAGLVIDSVDEQPETGIVWVQVSEKPLAENLNALVQSVVDRSLDKYPIMIDTQVG